MTSKNKPYKKIYPVLKWLLALASIAFFVYQWKNFDLIQFKAIKNTWIINSVVMMLIFLLMFSNWFIESIKFRLLLRSSKRLSPVRSFLTILGGMTVSNFTPARTGEYIGRGALLKDIHPVKVVVATVGGNIAQVITTYSIGLIAIAGFMITQEGSDLSSFKNKALYAFALLAVMFIVVWNAKRIISYLNNYLPKFLVKGLRIVKSYKRELFTKVLGLSVLRYTCFAVQYYLLLQMFSVKLLPVSYLLKVPIAYLLQSLVPVPAVSDVGVRVYISQLLFQDFVSANEALYAVTSLWFINLILPAMFGTLYLVYSLVRK